MCVARPSPLISLHIKPSMLKCQTVLRDVANVVLKPMGSTTCEIEYGSRTTTQEVFFVETSNRCSISLGIVHADFPHQSLQYHPSPPTATAASRSQLPACLRDPADMVPFSSLKENFPQLEEWRLRHFSASTFNTYKYPLPVMVGKSHQIHL